MAIKDGSIGRGKGTESDHRKKDQRSGMGGYIGGRRHHYGMRERGGKNLITYFPCPNRKR